MAIKGEIMDSWLPITEYAVKNRVSVSTIRRKIKNQEIKYKLESGKYFVLDESLPTTTNYIDTHKNTSAYNSIDEVLEFAERSILEITKLNSEIITEKEDLIREQRRKIKEIEEELTELRMLVNILEKKHTINV